MVTSKFELRGSSSPRFGARRQTTYLFLFVSLGHVLLISAQVQSKSGPGTSLAKAAAFGVFAGLQRATAAVANSASSVWTHYVALHGVVDENARLRAYIAALEGQVQQERGIAAQENALEEVVGLRKSLPWPTLAARVIAGDPTPGVLTVTIDRGSKDGVRKDMAVIAKGGVVGRIIEVSGRAAHVQLLTDHNAEAAVYFERTPDYWGLVNGSDGDPPLSVDYVSNLADLRVGDRVLTSGQDGIYPRGWLVGTVEYAEKGSRLYRVVAVRPMADFSHADLVLVVLGPAPKAPGGGS